MSWNFEYYVERTGFLFLDLVTVDEGYTLDVFTVNNAKPMEDVVYDTLDKRRQRDSKNSV